MPPPLDKDRIDRSSSRWDWRPLSRSFFWQQQRDFYAEFGPQAWSSDGGVPSYATSNSYFAEKYVDLLVALSECCTIPIGVLELGGGSGELAFLILQIWMERCWNNRWNPSLLFYVLTDFAESNIGAYLDHPQLRMHAESGLLDFAQVDVTFSRFPLALRFRKRSWQPHSPTAVIASYLFDSLPMDVISIRSYRKPFFQMFVKPDLQNGSYRTRMQPVEDYSEFTPELVSYILFRRDKFKSPQAFMIPIVSASVLLWLNRFHQRVRIPLVVVIADKGRSTNLELFPANDPKLPIATHNSFSFPVNFECLRFVAVCCQCSIWESKPNKNMKIMTISWNESPWVRQAVSNMDSLPTYLDLYYIFMKSVQFADLAQLFAMFQSSIYDPRLFFIARDRFQQLIYKGLNPIYLNQIADAYQSATRRCFALQGAPDFIFELGNGFLALRRLDLALSNYRLSNRLYGPDAVVLCRMSLILLNLNQLSWAKSCLQRAIFTNPAYSRAWHCLKKFSMC